MHRIHTSEKGFTPITVLLMAVIILIVGGTGVYVYRANSNVSNTLTSSPASPKTANTNLPKLYENKLGHFAVRYPSSWKLATESTIENGKVEPAIDPQFLQKITLTSPDGTVLHVGTNFGGRGGDCPPAANDEPFRVGNICSTKEYLSKEKTTNLNNIYYIQFGAPKLGITPKTVKKDSIVLVTAHYKPAVGPDLYTIGLAEDNPDFPVVVNKPHMGISYSQEYFTVTDKVGNQLPEIDAYATSESAAFLTSKDAATIKEILKTVNVVF